MSKSDSIQILTLEPNWWTKSRFLRLHKTGTVFANFPLPPKFPTSLNNYVTFKTRNDLNLFHWNSWLCAWGPEHVPLHVDSWRHASSAPVYTLHIGQLVEKSSGKSQNAFFLHAGDPSNMWVPLTQFPFTEFSATLHESRRVCISSELQ